VTNSKKGTLFMELLLYWLLLLRNANPFCKFNFYNFYGRIF